MRAVFLGTPESAVPVLDALVSAGHGVPLVVCQPDRPAGRSAEPRRPPVKIAAMRAGIPVLQPVKVRSAEFAAALSDAGPDVLVVVAYGRILPSAVFELPPHGAVNVHFSLLPAYRGAAPVPWALVRGETVTGVTTMRISEGLDEGDVLLQRPVPIEPDEHAPSLLARLSRVGASLLLETLEALQAGSLAPTSQDASRATSAPRLTRADGTWSPEWTASDIEGRIRGFDPWPGVWAARGGTRLRLVEGRARAEARADRPPGTILAIDGESALLACADGTVLAVTAVQIEGRRRSSVREAVNGRQIATGDRLQ